MKKDIVKKIEEEIKQKTRLPENIKEKIKKEIFVNIIIAIGLVIYFTFLILGSVGTIKNVRSTDFNIFSIIMLSIAIYLFEVSYKKDSGKLAMFGIEALVTAIFTLFLPYIIFELDKTHKIYYLIIGGYIGLYYIIKCIYLSLRMKKKYMTELSDIKDIIKKEKRKASIKENIPKTEKIVEIISSSEVDNQEKDKKEQDNNKAKLVNDKTKDTTKKTENKKEKDTAKKEPASKKQTSKIEENAITNNAPKKRGRPKKSETTNNENISNVEVEHQGDPKPKKRGRPKKEESLKKETDNKLGNAPKKRGRPRKVVTSND